MNNEKSGGSGCKRLLSGAGCTTFFYEAHGGGGLEIVECQAFADLFLAVESGRADAAVMAIENTVSGGLLPNFGLLRQSGRKIKCA